MPMDGKKEDHSNIFNEKDNTFEKDNTPKKKNSSLSNFDLDYIAGPFKSTPAKRKNTVATEGKSSNKTSTMKKKQRNNSSESIASQKLKKRMRKNSDIKPVLERANSLNNGYKIPSYNPRVKNPNSPTRLAKKEDKLSVYQKWLIDAQFYQSKKQNISHRKASDIKYNKKEMKKVKVEHIYPTDNLPLMSKFFIEFLS